MEPLGREIQVQRLLTAHRWNQPQSAEDPAVMFSDVDLPEGAVIGFHSTADSFLTSVATQVLEKRFITAKQLEVVTKILSDTPHVYQFSLGHPLEKLPDGMRWAGFEELQNTIPATRSDLADLEPDLRDGADRSFKVGKRTVDFSAQLEKPWGTLKAESDELVFYPSRYPTTNIKQASPHFKWTGKEGGWRHPGVHLEVVEKVIQVFGNVVVDESVELKLAEKVELVELPPDIVAHDTLFNFQKEATAFLLTHERCLLALAPGLGKTATAITAAAKLLEEGEIQTVGIVAPKSLLKHWQNEIDRWADDWSTILHTDFTDQPLDSNWLIVNYAALSLHKLPPEFETVDLVIFDETILLKTWNRVQRIVEDKRRWVFKTNRVQFAFELAKKVPRVWMLSGGPTSKFVDDLWAQFHILDPKRFSSYWRFAKDYCQVESNQWGESVIGNQPGAIKRIHENYADIFLARSQDQVLDLPDWIFEEIEVPMARKQETLYTQMYMDWVATLATNPDGTEIQLTAPNVLAQVTRLTQIASNPIILGHGITAISPKWQAVIDLLELRPKPAIIWTRFIETAKRMKDHLAKEGYSVGLLIGETSADTRAKIVEAFQRGNIDVIIAHPAVGKFGLTLTAARTTYYLENSYDGDDYYQSLHRVRRIGTTHAPLVIHVKSIHADGSPTIDHLITEVLENKAETTFKVTAAKLTGYLEGREELWMKTS